MATRKNSNESMDERTSPLSDANRINDEDNLDTREISNEIEEGDEDYDDEELDEADFDIDEDEEDDEDEEVK